MAGNSGLGIWHTTTFQLVQDRPQQQTAVTGSSTKRPAISGLKLSRAPPRLTASAIQAVPPLPGSTQAGRFPSEYTQRREFPSTPTAFDDPLLSLSHPVYGLPGRLIANFASLGIKAIYPWQKECLLGPGLIQGEKGLVYSAPTGGGKSLVADVLMLKRVFEDREAKAILVLPYVALVQEKVRWLRNVVGGISRQKHLGQQPPEDRKLWATRADKDTVKVVGFYGGSKIRAT
jgi:ATP-dependent helicase YprA (DUF1998 family)